MSGIQEFFTELKRRRVYRVAAYYAAVSFVLWQASEIAVPALRLPESVLTFVVLASMSGFPIALALAWAFEITADGVRLASSADVARAAGTGRFLAKSVAVLIVTTSSIGLGAMAWQLRGSNAAVRGSGSSASGLPASRVAVLYFDADSADEPSSLLAETLTEDLIEELSRVPGLDVISKNGVAPYKGNPPSADSVGRALGVGTVVWGRVTNSGESQVVFLRLASGPSGEVIQERRLAVSDAMLVTRDSVVAEVLQILRPWIGEELVLEARRTTRSTVAWESYKRSAADRRQALQAPQHQVIAGLQRADVLAARAAVEDPGWVEPVIARADGALDLANASLVASDRDGAVSWLEVALGHADIAVGMEPDMGRAFEVRGRVLLRSWEVRSGSSLRADTLLQRARSDLEEAVRLDPTIAIAYLALSQVHYAQQDGVAGLLAARRAYEEDPYLSNMGGILQQLFFGTYDLAEFAEAAQWCREGARRFPSDRVFVECQLLLLSAPGITPDIALAWDLKERMDSLTADRFWHHASQIWVGGVIGMAGLPDSADRVLKAARPEDMEVDPGKNLTGFEGAMRSNYGDVDGAVDRLKIYLTANPGHFVRGEEANWSWWWRNILHHPELTPLLQGG